MFLYEIVPVLTIIFFKILLFWYEHYYEALASRKQPFKSETGQYFINVIIIPSQGRLFESPWSSVQYVKMFLYGSCLLGHAGMYK